jgi:hypothetical protein
VVEERIEVEEDRNEKKSSTRELKTRRMRGNGGGQTTAVDGEGAMCEHVTAKPCHLGSIWDQNDRTLNVKTHLTIRQGYCTTLSAAIVYRQRVRLMDDELEIIWNEAVVACFGHYPGLCLEAMRKTTRNLSQNGPCLVQHSDRTPPECVSGALLLGFMC